MPAYRHDTTRKNLPPAGLAMQGKVAEMQKMQFAYDPHWAPVLSPDLNSDADRVYYPIQSFERVSAC